jgi:hypothetical protein
MRQALSRRQLSVRCSAAKPKHVVITGAEWTPVARANQRKMHLAQCSPLVSIPATEAPKAVGARSRTCYAARAGSSHASKRRRNRTCACKPTTGGKLHTHPPPHPTHTGGNTGIGFISAKVLCEKGYKVRLRERSGRGGECLDRARACAARWTAGWNHGGHSQLANQRAGVAAVRPCRAPL